MKQDRAVLTDKWHYFLNGVEVTESEYEKQYPPPPLAQAGEAFGGTPTKGWPIKSRAMAVHPKQVQAATEAAQKAGVPTEFLPDGRPIIRSQQHQNQYARTRGLQNHDTYYN